MYKIMHVFFKSCFFNIDDFVYLQQLLGDITKCNSTWVVGKKEVPILYAYLPFLTLILLTWRIWRAPNNVMGFNWSFKWLKACMTAC